MSVQKDKDGWKNQSFYFIKMNDELEMMFDKRDLQVFRNIIGGRINLVPYCTIDLLQSMNWYSYQTV